MSGQRSPEANDGVTRPASILSRADSLIPSRASIRSLWSERKRWRQGKWRHTLGITLLLVTVVLWTASNFLASTIFADDTYSKPYFVTYVNTAFFVIPLIPILVRKIHADPSQLAFLHPSFDRKNQQYAPVDSLDEEEASTFLKPTNQTDTNTNINRPLHTGSPSSSLIIEDGFGNSQFLSPPDSTTNEKLSLHETAKLSLEFCCLWFAANYFVAACLEYTTVASSTILTSTSSVWTLLIGALMGVEKFTFRKLLGVLASLAGIVLISSVDLSGGSTNEDNRGDFPYKSPREIAIGDALAFLSAVMYGIYAIIMKKRIGDENRVNMPLFFGLVGLFNLIALWPGFIILHFTGVETFELPTDGRVIVIVLTNSFFSLIADYSWAYAMLLTSPLVTTVGLSLTIPLSLIGQMILDSQYSSVTYWIGACVVLLSFIVVNREEEMEEEEHLRESIIEEGILHVEPAADEP